MTDTLTPPPLPTEEAEAVAPKRAKTWTISIDVPVGDEVVHVVARMEPESMSVGEARARERLSGVALIDFLVPLSESGKAVMVAARLIGAHPEKLAPLIPDGATADQVALALVDDLPLPALMACMTVEYE